MAAFTCCVAQEKISATLFEPFARGFVPVWFAHSVICQKSSVTDDTGEFAVENVFQRYVVVIVS